MFGYVKSVSSLEWYKNGMFVIYPKNDPKCSVHVTSFMKELVDGNITISRTYTDDKYQIIVGEFVPGREFPYIPGAMSQLTLSTAIDVAKERKIKRSNFDSKNFWNETEEKKFLQKAFSYFGWRMFDRKLAGDIFFEAFYKACQETNYGNKDQALIPSAEVIFRIYKKLLERYDWEEA